MAEDLDEVEKVARALCIAAGQSPDVVGVFGELPQCETPRGRFRSLPIPLDKQPLWHGYVSSARAAIEAMKPNG